MDGSIVIGTKLDSSKLEKQLTQLEKQLEKYFIHAKRLEEQRANLEINTEDAEKKLDIFESKLFKMREKIAEKQQAVDYLSTQNAWVQHENQYKEQVEELEKMKIKYDDMVVKQEHMVNNLSKIENKHKNIINEITINNQKINETKEAIAETKDQLERIPLNITDGLKSGFDKLLKSAKRLAMGILGIRASYSLVRKMASSYLADNEKTANRINNIWTGLGVILGNTIEGLVNLLKKAVTAILYFISLLTNVNYIAKANEAILKKQTKATSNLRKEQDKLNASFDEMEVLQDSTSNSGIGGVSFTPELFDVEELGKAKEIIEKLAEKLKPVWEIIKKIVEFSIKHPDVIIGILGGIALVNMLSKILGIAGVGGSGLLGILGVLTAIAAIGTIVISIKTLIENFKETKEYNEEVQELTKNQKKYRTELEKTIRTRELNDEQIKKETLNKYSYIKLQKEEITNIMTEMQDYEGLQSIIYMLNGTEKTQQERIKALITGMSEQIKTMNKLYEQGLLNAEETALYSEMLNDYREILGQTDKENKYYLNTLKQSSGMYDELDTYINEANNAYKEFQKSTTLTGNESEETAKKISEVNKAMNDLKNNKSINLKVDADTKLAQNKLKQLGINIWSYISGGLGSFGGGGSIGGRAKGGMYYPKLAVGGIINQPGKGIPYHGATIGERGAEAVIPLTDSQQMELLGEAIGKYITINANMNNYMNGRLISREIQKIQNQSDFTKNR